MHNYKTIGFLLFAICFIACKSNRQTVESQQEIKTVLVDTNTVDIIGAWKIISITKEQKKIDLPYLDWNMRMTFEEGNQNVGIKTPCNSGGCKYTINKTKISIDGSCFMTEMYCDDENRNAWEKKLIKILHKTYTIVELDKGRIDFKGLDYSIELIRD